jgi:UDP-N-acetylmuramate-alanine ligase
LPVFGIKAACKTQLGTDNLKDVSVAIQGLGKVGHHLAERLAKDGAKIFATDIYPAGESPIEGIHAKNLYEGILQHGHRDVTYIPDKADIAPSLASLVQPGDMVITLGAGDVWKVGDELAEKLKERK